nr:hypothetical protein [Roseobacter litoralis]
MRAHGGINPAARLVLRHDQLVQGFAHPMQALELIGSRILRNFQNGGDGMGVMRGELRVNPVGHAQQLFRVANIGHIGRGLMGIDGETVDAFDLRALDFSVPIGPLHQAHHDFAVVTLGHIIKRINHGPGARPISLHHDAEAIPARQSRFAHNLFDNVQRKCEPVGLLCINVKAHSRRFRQQCQGAQTRHQIGHHGLFLGDLIAWVQGGQLDGYAWIAPDVLRSAGRGNRGDRTGITQVIPLGIRFGAGGLTQHIIGVGKANFLHVCRALHSGIDVLSKNELTPHLFHGAAHGGPDHGFTKALYRST